MLFKASLAPPSSLFLKIACLLFLLLVLLMQRQTRFCIRNNQATTPANLHFLVFFLAEKNVVAEDQMGSQVVIKQIRAHDKIILIPKMRPEIYINFLLSNPPLNLEMNHSGIKA